MAGDLFKTTVDLNADDVAWFRETYPSGSLSGTMSMLFSAFREANTFTPQDYALIAAKNLTEKMRNRE